MRSPVDRARSRLVTAQLALDSVLAYEGLDGARVDEHLSAAILLVAAAKTDLDETFRKKGR